MKALVIVADTSYKGEYSMAIQALRQLGISNVETCIVSKTVNVNFTYDLSDEFDEDVIQSHDLIVFIGGYWSYYSVKGMEMPGKVKPIVNKESFEKALIASIKSNKYVVLPFAVPAHAAKLGLLAGKKATVYPTTDLIYTLRLNNVEFVNENVVVDGNVMTLKRMNVEAFIEGAKSWLQSRESR